MRILKSINFWGALSVTMTLAVGITIAIVFWGWFREGPTNVESNGATIRNIGLIIGGAVALVFGIWRTVVAHRQLDVAQRGLLNDRYQKGAEMLGNNSLAGLGGIYALRNLAEESPERYHVQVMALLCAFVRHPIEEDSRKYGIPNEDILAAVYVIVSRHPALIEVEEKWGFVPNLSGASLFRTDLSGAILTNANLSRASLLYVNLSDVVLTGANLSRANLNHANLSGTMLVGADLSGARLFGADLTDAMLPGANLSDAELLKVSLSRANLSGANLSGADLSHPEEPGLYEVLDLTQAQLDQAIAYPDNPPKLDGVLDVETGEQLVWRGEAPEEEQT